MITFLFALLTLLQIGPADKTSASTFRVVGYYGIISYSISNHHDYIYADRNRW